MRVDETLCTGREKQHIVRSSDARTGRRSSPVRAIASGRALMTLSTDIAQAILDGFDKHYSLFRMTSFEAKDRFERADWNAVVEAQKERIGMYDRRVAEAVAAVTARFPDAGRE